MKRFIHIIVFVAAALVATSCVEPLNTIVPNQNKDLTLSFSCGVMTKAESDVNNEDLVKRVDYFIFPCGADGKVADTQECAYSGSFETNDTAGDDLYKFAKSYTQTIDHQYLADIFPNGNTKAVVFAIANYVDYYGANNDMVDPAPNTTLPNPAGDKYTWGELHSLEVGATFFYDDHNPNFEIRWPHTLNPEDEDFFLVMACDSAVISMVPTSNQDAGGAVVNGVVPLKRLASKVTVNFTYDVVVEQKESGNITWVPQPLGDQTRVYLSNAIEHTTLGGPLKRALVADSWGTRTMPKGDGTRDIFEYAYNFMKDVPEIDGKKTAHFYTYPLQFEAGDDNQPYLKLVLPWYGYKYKGEGTAPTFENPEAFNPNNPNWVLYKQKEVYYKIVLPRSTINKPNYIYEYAVNVNIVGSDKEVKIIGEEYVVKDWGTKEPVSSNVATGRYISLDIPKDEYDMYVNTFDISFVSSGTVTPIVKEIYQLNYSQDAATKDYFMQDDEVTATDALKTRKGVTNADIEGWVSIPEGSHILRINHVMDSHMTTTNQQGNKVTNTAFDMAPYVFVVTLHLDAAGDDISFDRTVTITQYPPMYITARTNTNYSHQNNNDEYGYVFIDSQSRSTSGWDAVRGLASENNQNPNMYLIRTSILGDLGDDFNFIIGDPRQTNSSTLGNTFGRGRWTEDANITNHRLTYYYPTSTDAASSNIISPLFRVASSYGVCSGTVSDNEARLRCAAYQEDGYPAGRWRVPTFAEIQFIATLSARGFIPTLFNRGGNYHSASTRVHINTDGTISTTNNNSYVRCVYDEWYWGSDRLSDITVFTWGDRQR